MKTKLFVLSLIALLLIPLALPVSAGEWEIDYSDSVDWDKFRGQNVTLNVYNWGEYIAVDEGGGEFDVNREFEELTGINVTYSNFASNEELYAKMKSGGGAAYDIIIPSDYMIARLINEGMLEELNFDNIPNYALIDDRYKNLAHDPENKYSVPYTWGTVGIVYNTTLVDPEDEIDTWAILWDEKYAGDILMFSNSRDAFMIAEKLLGYSLNTSDEAELRAAAQKLKDQKYLVQAYVMDEIYDKMGGGEAALAPYYAGDAIMMMDDNPDLDFVVPKEGTNLFVDSICIPKGAKNKEAAEMYINFMCETLTAKMNIEWIGYGSPHTEAFELLDEEIKEDPIIYPPSEILDNSEVYIALPDKTTSLIDSLWTDILSEVGTNPWATPIMLVILVALIIFINVFKYRRSKMKEQL
nr:ABC transporter substrate-binding protein [Clostridia bacterium]